MHALPPLPPRFALYAAAMLALVTAVVVELPDAFAWAAQTMFSAIP